MEHRILPRYPIGNPRRIWRQDNFVLSTFSARGQNMRSVIENCADAGFNLLEMGWASHEQAEEALRLCEEIGIDLLYQDFSVFGGGISDREMTQDGEDMTADIKDPAWASLSYAEKNRELFERRKRLLGMFLERRAISKEQYEKSLHDLTENMGRKTDR